jgi:Serine dehydrogenase proteinase
MSLLTDYIQQNRTPLELQQELVNLIKLYNAKTGRYLFVYAAAMSKQVPAIPLSMDDYYVIFDLLRNVTGVVLDFYIETPGGSGEAAEEIVRFLRDKFTEVSFVVSGEAKSAGTIMVLSGDEIKMTRSGSLGPIDAQMEIGRSIASAYDYMEWINEKRIEAQEQGGLNPFDATMVAQISPGELRGVNNALNFAKDIVQEWLVTYKFRDWKVTTTKKQEVTSEAKKARAAEIVDALVNHTRWRSHGRSLKITDLEQIGLRIKKLDDEPG